MWQIFALFWQEIRPDHWYPLLQFRDGTGELRGGTFLYGGLKRDWEIGEQLEIARDGGLILPLHAPWLRRKAVGYALFAAALLALSLLIWGQWWSFASENWSAALIAPAAPGGIRWG